MDAPVSSPVRVTCPRCGPFSSRLFTKRGLTLHIRRMHADSTAETGQSQHLDSLSSPPSVDVLETLADLRARVKVLKHIPKGARSLAALKLSTTIERCLQTNSVNDWCILLTFAYTAFKVPESGDDRKSLTSKVKDNLEATFSYLPNGTSTILGSPTIYKIVENKVYDGDLRGAVRILTSECSMAPSNSTTLASLRDKHPVASHPDHIPSEPNCDVPPLSVSCTEVTSTLGSFHASSAGGLDGIRPQHLKELISTSAGDNGTRLTESLTKMCNFLLEGKLNSRVCPFLYGASLCALIKKDGGIRPIAVGSVIRRLVAKLGCRAVREKVSGELLPHQLGFGVPLGCEAAIHATRAFAIDPEHKDDVILKIDIKNAFNSVGRGVMLTEARDKIPSLCPFLWQCYASPSNLYFDGQKITSEIGAQQGDPLGPLLFSLAINQIIVSLEAQLNVWYLDDGTIGGAPDLVARDLATLIAKLKDVGLEINGTKCEIFPCSGLAVGGAASLEQLVPGARVVDRQGLSLLGAPIFADGVPAALDGKMAVFHQVKERLCKLPAHVALTLLRGCLAMPKLVYLMRTSPTWRYPQEVFKIDGAIKDTLETVLNVHLEDSHWLQASLPVRHGGLGVRRMQDMGVPAFLASSHGVVQLATKILKYQGGDFDTPFVGEALTVWSHLCPDFTPPVNPAAQRQWDDTWCKYKMASLLNAASGTDIARLKAASSPESGAWLHALPSPHLGTALDDVSLRVAVALRLGCDVCEPHICKCGVLVDAKAHHGLGCGKSAGRFPRHHMLNEIIRRALVSAGVPCTLEPPGLSREDGKRPDGLTLVPWEKGRSLVWDATCVSTFAASHLARSTREAGAAAEWQANQKRHKYSDLSSPYVLIPFAVEVAGPWCTEAKAFVRDLGRRLRRNGCDPRAGSYLTQHIALAIQRGNAASVMGTFASGVTRGGLFD